MRITPRASIQNTRNILQRGTVKSQVSSLTIAVLVACMGISTFADIILPPDAYWGVTDVSIQSFPTNLGTLRAPFSTTAYAAGTALNGVPGNFTSWNTNSGQNSTWLLQTKVNLPNGLNFSQVQWSAACDNSYELTVNGFLIKADDTGAIATFSDLTQFPDGVLRYGVNDIDVIISGNDPPVQGGFWQKSGDNNDYFDMFITTDSCISFPIVTITSPGTERVCAGLIDITATVVESMANGGSSVPSCPGNSITSAGFYDGSNLLATITSPGSPITFNWANPPRGVHQITVRATDTAGISAQSAPIFITVCSTPTVSIIGPTEGQGFCQGSTVTLTASATELEPSTACTDGASINRVTYYTNGVQVGFATVSPFTVMWNPPNGNYTLIAIATDNLGSAATSGPVHISVGAVSYPQVTMTSPFDGDFACNLGALTYSETHQEAPNCNGAYVTNTTWRFM